MGVHQQQWSVYALMQDPNQIDQANKVLAGVGQEQYKDDKAEVKHIVQPLSDIHYNEDIGNGRTTYEQKRS